MFPAADWYRPYFDTSSDDASITGEDEAFLQKQSPALTGRRRQRSFLHRICSIVFNLTAISAFLSLLTSILVISALLVVFHSEATIMIALAKDHKQPGALPQYHCGSTPEEARAQGCKFDVMSFAWTPPGQFLKDHLALLTDLTISLL
jgi:hypothetical protein